MRRTVVVCAAVCFAACPAPQFQFDAGFEFPDAGLTPDDGGCGEQFMPTSDLVLEMPGGTEGVQQPTCLLPGTTYTVTFPTREVVQLRLSGDGHSSATLQRGGDTLLQTNLTDVEMKGWFFAGVSSPVTLTLHASADAGHATTSVITWSRTGYEPPGAVLSSEGADGGFVEYVDPGVSPATAPLLPSSTGGFHVGVTDSALRLADTPGCEHPTASGWSYYAVNSDGGDQHWSNLNNVIEFEAVVIAADGGIAASGALDPSYEFTLTEPQRLVFGWSGLDGGVTSTCAFDGGLPPLSAYFAQQSVWIQ